MPTRFLTIAVFLALALLLPACATVPAPSTAREEAQTLARSAGFAPLPLQGGGLTLAAWAKNGTGADLVVYIEGDGHAWDDRRTPSQDPTPRDPLVLRLAALDPAPTLLYLARPCQYQPELPQGCDARLWTSARYGLPTVLALSQALDQAKAALGATRLHLVGYSGGGALAVLLAARRSDVADILTVAANLDTAAWTAHHNISPLTESLNPADSARSVAAIPQTHVAGAGDAVVPPFLCRRFLERMGQAPRARCLDLDGLDHRHGLEARWPDILARHRAGLPAATGGGLP